MTFVSKHWSVTEWDCLKRSANDYAWDNSEGCLCTNNEATANLFRVLDMLREWNPNWGVNNTRAGYKSGYRTPKINALVGGVRNSAHTKGAAADIRIHGQRDNAYALGETVIAAARCYPGLEQHLGIGYYLSGWVHIDMNGCRSWEVDDR